jgi:Ca2+-binding EF-hand superfamily protein
MALKIDLTQTSLSSKPKTATTLLSANSLVLNSMTNNSNNNSNNRSSNSLHHYYHELSLDEEERLEKLFRQLDIDGNGLIDVNDLRSALESQGIKATHENVKVIQLFGSFDLKFF